MKKNLFLASCVFLLSLGLLFHVSIKNVSADSTDASVDELISIILSWGSLPTWTETTWTVTTWTVTTWSIVLTWTNIETWSVIPWTNVVTWTTLPVESLSMGTISSWKADPFSADQEFVSALLWLYSNGLTQYSTTNQYNPSGELTRQQAAKFFVVFAQKVAWKQIPVTTSCVFSDTGFDSTLKQYVLDACALGVMVGKEGVFRPNDKISKAEFTTVLLRIIIGNKLDETTSPWWLTYYMQARNMWLTKEQNANAFDGNLSRYAAALLLYRTVGKIYLWSTQVNPSEFTWNITTGTLLVTGSNNSDNATTSGLIADVPLVSSLTADPALQEAIYRLHDIGVTKYTDINDFRPFDSIQRQEAAKMFLTFRYAIGSQISSPLTITGECQFVDLVNADQTLVPYIHQACSVGILKWSSDIYQPFNELTRAQAISILLRITDGYQDESGSVWWQKYYDRALQLGMISPSSPENFEKPISRYEVAVLLYKSKIQKDILWNLNNDFEKNKFIFTISPTETLVTTGNLTGLVSINTYLLESNPNWTYVVDLFWKQYKILKTATQKYLENDYVWYWKMLLLDETKEIWTVAMTISDGIIISGILRPYILENTTYTIKPSQQQPYYLLSRVVY